jgi:pimeloyl-ACP methyl ester carboxylesterase
MWEGLMIKPQKAIVEIAGTQMYYEIVGEGDCLCLIHGNTMDTRVWDAQFDYFSRYFRVLRYDLRGCGKSAEPKGIYAFDRDLKALLDDLQIEKTTVMGISVGGGIALNFALNYPENVSALIPVDPYITGYEWPHTAPRLRKLINHVQQGDAEAARAIWNDMPWFDQIKQRPSVYPKFAEIVSENSGWFFERPHAVNWGDKPIASRLMEITVPTMVVVGEHDTPDNHEVARILVSGIKDCRQLTVPDSGHMTMMEQPDFFNQHVLEFLQSVESDSVTLPNQP